LEKNPDETCDSTNLKMDYIKKVDNLRVDGNLADNWKKFRQAFDIFVIAAEVDTKKDPIKVAILLNAVGEEARDLFETFGLPAADKISFEKVLAAFENHCLPKKNILFERSVFYHRHQADGEPFEKFLFDVKKFAQRCDFPDESKMIRDRIVLGLYDKDVQAKLIQSGDINADKVIEICKTAEIIKHQTQQIQQQHPAHQIQGNMCKLSLDEIAEKKFNYNYNCDNIPNTSKAIDNMFYKSNNANNRFRKNNHDKNFSSDVAQYKEKRFVNQNNGQYEKNNYGNMRKQNSNFGTNKNDTFYCNKCNSVHAKRQCPAFGKRCANCNSFNHFASSCNLKKIKTISINGANTNTETDSDEFYVDSLQKIYTIVNTNEMKFNNVNVYSRCHQENLKKWTEIVRIEDTFVEFKLDSGSEVNVLPQSVLKKLGQNLKVNLTKITLEAYGGSRLQPTGTIDLMCRYKNEILIQTFVVIAKDTVPILGLETCVKLGLIKRIHSVQPRDVNPRANFISENEDVFGGLGRFREQYKIHLKSGYVPKTHAPRRIPLKIRDQVKKQLNELENKGIISKVHEPREWLHNIVIVEKSNKSLRICLDPRELNKYIEKDYYLIPTLEDLTSKLSGAAFFSVLDIKDGFWHVELDPESRKLCSFSSPFGNYEWNRLPFGISCAPELFQRYNFETFGDIPGVFIYIDDILIMGRSKLEHDSSLRMVVQRARERNVRFNPGKFQYNVPQVKYLGLIFSAQGYTVDSERIRDIENLSDPTSRKELQSFLGMVNFLRGFIPKMSDLTAPLRTLMKNQAHFSWTATQSEAVLKIKNAIKNAAVLHPFDEKSGIIIQTDSSSHGLGCCLMQAHGPIAYASRALSDTETRYGQIEKEFLAILFACKKYHNVIYGRKVMVQSDHQPLVSVMLKDFHKIASNRLQRILLKLLNYDLDIVYTKGKFMHIADYLSRFYPKLNQQPPEEEKCLKSIIHSLNVSDERLIGFKQATEKDGILKALIVYYKNGWPNDKSKIPEDIRFYFKHRNDIFVENGLVFMGDRLIVPKSLRSEMLVVLHEAHFGIVKTKRRAKELLYWPNMMNEIENYIGCCSLCEKNAPSNPKERMIPHEVPDLPFEKVACDILHFRGKDFLVLIDYFSKWIELRELKNKTSAEIILHWSDVFSTFGIPLKLIADNNPFNSFECREFARKWDFSIVTSSPHYPRSNGLAERAVGIAKGILKKSRNFLEICTSLMEYRNTPVKDMHYSPAQLLMNRRVRTKLPIKKDLLVARFNEDVREQQSRKTHNNAKYYDRNAKDRKPFGQGDNVLIKDGKSWKRGKVVSKFHTPRSYTVSDEGGTILRRNSLHLKHSRNEPEPPYKHYYNFESENDNFIGENETTNGDLQMNNQNDIGQYRTRFGRLINIPKQFVYT
jgi:hypothetical protein